MFPRHSSTAICAAPRGRQRGVYALEWAIIFPVFFALLYGIICYGLTFLVRSSMQHAVEEGARAALRYAPTWADREVNARETVANALAWLPATLRPNASNVKFTVCRVSSLDDKSCTQDSSLNAGLACDIRTPCMVLVSYTITGYRDNAIAPAIPGLGLVLPVALQASASLLVDRRML